MYFIGGAGHVCGTPYNIDMAYTIIMDTFYAPHNEGIKAQVTPLGAVTIEKNLFGEYDARAYATGSDEAEEFSNARIGVEDPYIRKSLCLDRWLPCYPDADDTVLWCRRSGDILYWYKVEYGYDCKKDN